MVNVMTHAVIIRTKKSNLFIIFITVIFLLNIMLTNSLIQYAENDAEKNRNTHNGVAIPMHLT